MKPEDVDTMTLEQVRDALAAMLHPECEKDGPDDWFDLDHRVNRSHPEIGKPGPVTISRYQFFVELQGGKLSIDLPPTQTEYEVPFGAADRGRVFKFEIIARTSTGNNTAVESCFKVK